MDPRWNAFVVDRKTLKLDIDMRDLVDVKVKGQWMIDGAPPLPGWTVKVVRPPHDRGATARPAKKVDRQGQFVLTARPGRARLRFVGPLPGGARCEVWREILLKGPQLYWQKTMSTASVQEHLEDESIQARFVRGLDEKSNRELTTVPVDKKRFLRARIPVGRSVLQTRPKSRQSIDDWTSVRMVETN
ncbi:MAG: hypothetical protein V3W41_06305 [Planctomycetota bacterium]